jgi:hypothetical protein
LEIRKYLNGELDAHAMHELERRALDDPFLMDALEGFELTDKDQQANLNDLAGRLHRRTEKKQIRMIPWGRLSAAASVVIILGGAIWFFSSKHNEEKGKLVASDITIAKKEAPAAPAPVVKDTLAAAKQSTTAARMSTAPEPKNYSNKKADVSPQPVEQQLAEADDQKELANDKLKAAKQPADANGYGSLPYEPKKDSVAANELIVSAMEKQKKPAAAKSKASLSEQTQLQGKVAGVTVTPNDMHTIVGTVKGADDGMPIVGATVRVVGRSFGAVTDVNGKFVLQDVAKNQTLSVNYIGYNAKKVKADDDSMSITLDPAGNSLAEVVVVKDKDTENVDAHPKDGWKAFNDYLKKNSQSPDGKTGKVKVSFSVAADGSLSQFKIIKSLSDVADKQAIILISNGPVWLGNTDGKSKSITVSIKFR